MILSSRPFDLLVFGATGFTGKEVARYVCRQWFNKRIKSFALAGRSRDRLDVVAKEVFSETRRASGAAKRQLSEIGIIIADCNDESTLTSMASVSRIVLNCVGPYRFTGKLVVQACVDAKTHYLDVCGEPQFMEDSHMTFHESAVKNCTVIVHACGFDSIPADLGWLFVCDQFQRIHQCSCRTVEEAFQVQTGSKGAVGHYATLQSAVEGISDQETLMKIRKQLNEKYPVTYHFKKPIRSLPFQHNSLGGAWAMVFPGADASVVRQSQRLLFNKQSPAAADISSYNNGVIPGHSAYFMVSSLLYVVLIACFGVMFKVLTMTSFGKKLLLQYPGFFTMGYFSHEGPTEQQMRETSFTMHLIGKGETANGAKVFLHATCTGPEPGYVATPIVLVESALMLLVPSADGKKVLVPTGGVFPPAAAFFGVREDLYANLKARGVSFAVQKVTD